MIYLVSHTISQTSDGNLRLIIGYSKPLELLQIHIRTDSISTNKIIERPVVENQEESIDLDLCRKIVEHNGGKLERLT